MQVAGERDPYQLAAYRDPNCKAPIASLRAALVGNDGGEHVNAAAKPSRTAPRSSRSTWSASSPPCPSLSAPLLRPNALCGGAREGGEIRRGRWQTRC